MKQTHHITVSVSLAFVPALLVWLSATSAAGYERYHNPNTQGQGYCATCHTGFLDGPGSVLHDQHATGANPFTPTCSLCHTGSGRDNPFIMWSQNNLLGCMGCHGLDYGETIRSNYNGFAIQGLHKNSGYGLRRHHARAGVAICATCHTNDLNVAPYGENVIVTGRGFTSHYYLRADVSQSGLPVNPCTNEDSPDDIDMRGLDNDGDGVYDAADPDCVGAPVALTVQVTSANTTILSWPYTFDGWHVQSTASLGGAIWNDLPDVPRETTNGTWQVILPTTTGTRLYRLAKTLY